MHGLVRITFQGSSFLLNQVRLMVGTALACLHGHLPREHLAAALRLPVLHQLPKAPAEGLVQGEVHFSSQRGVCLYPPAGAAEGAAPVISDDVRTARIDDPYHVSPLTAETQAPDAALLLAPERHDQRRFFEAVLLPRLAQFAGWSPLSPAAASASRAAADAEGALAEQAEPVEADGCDATSNSSVCPPDEGDASASGAAVAKDDGDDDDGDDSRDRGSRDTFPPTPPTGIEHSPPATTALAWLAALPASLPPQPVLDAARHWYRSDWLPSEVAQAAHRAAVDRDVQTRRARELWGREGLAPALDLPCPAHIQLFKAQQQQQQQQRGATARAVARASEGGASLTPAAAPQPLLSHSETHWGWQQRRTRELQALGLAQCADAAFAAARSLEAPVDPLAEYGCGLHPRAPSVAAPTQAAAPRAAGPSERHGSARMTDVSGARPGRSAGFGEHDRRGSSGAPPGDMPPPQQPQAQAQPQTLAYGPALQRGRIAEVHRLLLPNGLGTALRLASGITRERDVDALTRAICWRILGGEWPPVASAAQHAEWACTPASMPSLLVREGLFLAARERVESKHANETLRREASRARRGGGSAEGAAGTDSAAAVGVNIDSSYRRDRASYDGGGRDAPRRERARGKQLPGDRNSTPSLVPLADLYRDALPERLGGSGAAARAGQLGPRYTHRVATLSSRTSAGGSQALAPGAVAQGDAAADAAAQSLAQAQLQATGTHGSGSRGVAGGMPEEQSAPVGHEKQLR
jgi:hypothetical protein